MTINSKIAEELKVNPAQVQAAVALLDEGATVPFISRYRKEVTGGLDDTQLRNLEERLGYLREMEDRRDTILKSIEEQGKLSQELQQAILKAETKTQLEDLYLPYKPKRRTKAQIAREAGLEPLAMALLEDPAKTPEQEAEAAFVHRLLDLARRLLDLLRGEVSPGDLVDVFTRLLRVGHHHLLMSLEHVLVRPFRHAVVVPADPNPHEDETAARVAFRFHRVDALRRSDLEPQAEFAQGPVFGLCRDQGRVADRLGVEVAEETVEVQAEGSGCGQKLQILVVAKDFEGLTMIKQHRLVNTVAKDELAKVHAFNVKTYSPAKWAARSK